MPDVFKEKQGGSNRVTAGRIRKVIYMYKIVVSRKHDLLKDKNTMQTQNVNNLKRHDCTHAGLDPIVSVLRAGPN